MGVGSMRVSGVQSSDVHRPLTATSWAASTATPGAAPTSISRAASMVTYTAKVTSSKAKETSMDASTKASAEAMNPHTEKNGAENIILDISAEAAEAAKRAAKRKEEKLMRERQAKENYFATVLEEMRKAREQAESQGEANEDKYRCLEIAMRIMAGDNVPASDQRYLAEKDMDMYARAVSLRRIKEDPKDYESLLEDEDARTGNVDGAGGENGIAAVFVTGSASASDSSSASGSSSSSGSSDSSGSSGMVD